MLFKKKEKIPVLHEYPVVGMYYRPENVMKLAKKNSLYKLSNRKLLTAGYVMKRVYKYSFVDHPVKLVHEKKNEYDKNAVMVVVAGKHIGYIPAEDAPSVLNDLKHGISDLSVSIYGGEYRVVALDGDDVKLEEDVRARVRYIT